MNQTTRKKLPIGIQSFESLINETSIYRLGYPNEEVRRGFINALLPYYTYQHETEVDTRIYEL